MTDPNTPNAPGTYPGSNPPPPARPNPPFLESVAVGDVLLLLEPDGKQFRAVVTIAEPYGIAVTCRVYPGPALTRSFGRNGFEYGTPPSQGAELRPMPADRADKFRRRELFYEFAELLAEHGEEILPVDLLEFAVFAARRYARQRAEGLTRSLETLRSAYRAALRKANRIKQRAAPPAGTSPIVWTVYEWRNTPPSKPAPGDGCNIS